MPDDEIIHSSPQSSAAAQHSYKAASSSVYERGSFGSNDKESCQTTKTRGEFTLAEFNYVVNENYILPKSCVLLLLIFTRMEVIQDDKTHNKNKDVAMDVHCFVIFTYDRWAQ